MFTLFSGCHVGQSTGLHLRLHTGICKFVQNISTNTWSLGKRKDPKLGKVSSLPICYNIPISWLYPLNVFGLLASFRDSENHLHCISRNKSREIASRLKNDELISFVFFFPKSQSKVRTGFIQWICVVELNVEIATAKEEYRNSSEPYRTNDEFYMKSIELVAQC